VNGVRSHIEIIRNLLIIGVQRRGIALLAAALIAVPASAGQFSVTPVRIFMTTKDRAVAVTITNEGDEQLVMQADLYLWKQKPDGQDDLTLTEDIFLSPPIIKLAPKARQVVRLARVKAVNTGEQQTYRIVVREVPEAKPAKPDLQLQIALAFSIPVFISPPNVKPKMDCTVERAAGDTIRTVCQNAGNAFTYPVSFQLKGMGGDNIASRDSGGYILPGIKRSFDIKREGAAIPAGNARLVATLVDGTTQSFDVAVPQ
jgi:fimbrial chaperone protein